jgi:hypothetical protein
MPAQLVGDKVIEIMYVEEKIFCTGPTRAAKTDKNLLYRHNKSNETTKEGLFSLALFESPFTSVATVSWGHPPFSSLSMYHPS